MVPSKKLLNFTGMFSGPEEREREKTLFRQFVTSNQNKHMLQDHINGKRLHNMYKKKKTTMETAKWPKTIGLQDKEPPDDKIRMSNRVL